MYKLIIVDDEYMVLKGMQKLIDWEAFGFKLVETFQDGRSALEFLELNTDIQLVITDVTMPDMSGLDLMRSCDLPVYFIIISGYKDFNYVLEGLRLGAINYLTKPIDRVELQKNIIEVKNLILEDEVLKSSTENYFSYTLKQWLNNDIDEPMLKARMKNFGYELTGDLYTAAILKPLGNSVERIYELFEVYHQNFHTEDEEENIVLIINHDCLDLGKFVKALLKYNNNWFQLSMGETVNELEHVHMSYDHAYSSKTLMEFYRIDHMSLLLEASNDPVNFKSFNAALIRRDMEAITYAIDDIFKQLHSNKAKPSYVKHVTFMIFMDLKREFSIQSDQYIDDLVNDISRSHTSEKLREILNEALKVFKEKIHTAIYNTNVQQVIQIIMEDYDKELSLKSISQQLHINAMYLGQLFKKETGKSFSNYLNTYRITKAQELLVSTDLNIAEISEAVGYSSSGYFYKNFKLISGESPKEFKKRIVQKTSS